MKHMVTNHGRYTRGLFRPLAVEKKKTVAAACLVIVMAILWIRVLTNNGPATVEAVTTVEQSNIEDTSAENLNISFVKLPQVVGRNDVITRDFFASNDWRYFKGEKKHNLAVIEEVKNGNEEVIRKVAEKLKLEAIVVLSNKPRAFINNKVMSVGDKVLIRDGTNTYECEVIEIREKENIVVIKCGEAEVTLKLTRTLMVDN